MPKLARRKRKASTLKRWLVWGVLWLVLALVLGAGLRLSLGLGFFGPIGVWVLLRLLAGRERFRHPEGVTLDQLDQMDGQQFEAWIASFLRKHGFQVRDQPHSGDFGADVLCVPPGGTKWLAIQAKRHKGSVGNNAVQEAVSGAQYHDCVGAAVVTQSTFTQAARKQAAAAKPPVLLIDRAMIYAMHERLAVHARRLES